MLYLSKFCVKRPGVNRPVFLRRIPCPDEKRAYFTKKKGEIYGRFFCRILPAGVFKSGPSGDRGADTGRDICKRLDRRTERHRHLHCHPVPEGQDGDHDDALCAALFSIVVYSVAASVFGIPTSESHSLIAGLTGAAIAIHNGVGGVNFAEWVKVLYGLVLSLVTGWCSAWRSVSSWAGSSVRSLR